MGKAKYTKSFIQARFQRAADAAGWNYQKGPYETLDDGTLKAVVGYTFLNHAPQYGGWEVSRYSNDGGAEQQVSGWANRMSTSELIRFLDGVIVGAEAVAKAKED